MLNKLVPGFVCKVNWFRGFYVSKLVPGFQCKVNWLGSFSGR
jgi:hypothetical protein